MKAVTVTQVNEYIAKKLRDDHNLRGLAVEGEISALSRSGAHIYLTLKDAGSMLKCAVWASNIRRIDLKLLENGKKVVAVGDISPYAKGGSYSFSITHLEDAGAGDIMAEFNRIKSKLESEGLFDKRWKKPIPAFPLRVGVITSSTGAAVEDIRKIITSKNNLTDILIFPTQVQGEGAPASIVANIRLANELASGGLRIPVISAVGHESDFSISDFVADVRAETPTAAADMAVMNTFELRDDILSYKEMLVTAVRRKIESERMILTSRTDLLYSNMKGKLENVRREVDKAMIMIRENDPRSIFAKGYAAVTDQEGRIVPDTSGITAGSVYTVKMHNGHFKAEVLEVVRDSDDD